MKDDPELSLCIGIHIRDVIFEDGDILGDGVNVASRIEQLAEPGGIYISERVYYNIRNKPDIQIIFLGEKLMKNFIFKLTVYFPATSE
ncbi:MAG: adenylate/guanylate cyclase domain-containing protein [Candidatus Marinimicrobia bacterium]|nr:adenylate/guanylate cyclase domain-containing protein [Candidatus Neomarinimicrobiota bacterium]